MIIIKTSRKIMVYLSFLFLKKEIAIFKRINLNKIAKGLSYQKASYR